MKTIFTFLFMAVSVLTFAQDNSTGTIVINADLGKETISRHIYGHFSEHLGHCIYEGYWVGEDSDIPNTRGIRNDVVEALRELDIPNLRWPGGCFADEYHWREGIGPRNQRPTMINTHWGGVTEDNSFGTHEFLELCEQLGTEPYICGNLGSGTVEEMSDWVEYVNFDGISPMADRRRANGQDNSWGVKYWGVGNENWGCGGHMTAEFYAHQYRRYATYCRSYEGNRLMKVAGGAWDEEYEWTETLMKEIPHWLMWGISYHHYMTDWDDKGSATEFTEEKYFKSVAKAVDFGRMLDRHITIMDKYDPEERVAFVVDEWGTWWDVEPGTNPGFLYQQNSLRDAMVAVISLHHFNQRCSRIRMANIAQTVNVLQAMILTDKEKMILTPTYHVFNMLKVHQDATMLPLNLETPEYKMGEQVLPSVSASASKDAGGIIHISMANIEPNKAIDLQIDMRGTDVSKMTGSILTADELTAHNTFENPNRIKPAEFSGGKIKDNIISVKLPAKSIVVLEIQ
ncbi:MAG: alpha-N-arabinofuranosidase [Bacteroidales bacterium]|nr:alpha-N-arabinofuranosidase [Bacteroidales bacterium]